MNGFHDVSLPDVLARAVRGGPVDATELVTFALGREMRVQARSRLRRRYEISTVDLGPEEAYTLLSFFEARRGRLFAFRLRDPVDHRSCGPLGKPGPLDQAIGVGDGATRVFNLHKSYVDAGGASTRSITKPAPGTVRVSIDGREAGASAFACDAAPGRVTFAIAPPAGAAIRAGFMFDVPVRFDVDRLDLPLAGSGRAAVIALVEAES
jgi:uncharacterized protein (TIGR02217 family)